jgi:hypothetical protein
MAAAFVQLIGVATPVGNDSTIVLTTTATAVVGERIVVQGYWVDTAGTSTLSSVADSAGNTWSIDVQAMHGTAGIAICSAHVTSQLTSGGTITLTFSNANPDFRIAHAETFSGVASSSAVDSTSTRADDFADQQTIASAASTNDSAMVGAFGIRGGTDRSWVPDAPAIEIAESFNASGLNAASQYKILTVSGSYDMTGDWNAVDGSDGAVAHVIYKGGGAATVLVVPPIRRVF